MHYLVNLLLMGLLGSFCVGNAADAQRKPIAPLINTTWGQDAPYHYLTPTIEGSHTRTGCLATAMSQILYYHKYPEQGKQAVKSYSTGQLGTVAFDFRNNPFEYDKMKESYTQNASYTDESALAVAKLMAATGVSVNMTYRLDESSGLFAEGVSALSDWFLYPSDGLAYISRTFFTLEEWEALIYSELENKRPVLYMGGNGTNSHIFVCDGYENGRFHMNWGWNGDENCYVDLSNIQTKRPGFDGLRAYNNSQSIIIGIRKPSEAAPAPLATASSFSYNSDSEEFSLSSYRMYIGRGIIRPGVRAMNQSTGNETVIWADNYVDYNGSVNISYKLDFSIVPDGTYILRPIYKIVSAEDRDLADDEYFNVHCNIVNDRYIDVSIVNHTVVSASGGTDREINIAVSEFTPSAPFIKGEVYHSSFTFRVENNGNSNITRLGLRFYNPDTDELIPANVNSHAFSVAPGESKIITHSLPSNLQVGRYDMVILDTSNSASYVEISEPFPIVYHSATEIMTPEGSDFRYMPFSEKNAIILPPKASMSAPSENISTIEIPSAISLYGTDYVISEIGPRLLYGNPTVESISIPATVDRIDAQAFANCDNLKSVSCYSSKPPVLGTSVFGDVTLNEGKLIVPYGCYGDYMSDSNWSLFSNIVEAGSDNSFIMQPCSVAKGKVCTTTMNLTTELSLYGCEFELELPEGLSIPPDGLTLAEALNAQDFRVAYNRTGEQTYKVILYATGMKSLPKGESNGILSIVLSANQNFSTGIIKITNIIFAVSKDEVTDTDIEFNSSTCVVTLDMVSSMEKIADDKSESVSVFTITGLTLLENENESKVRSSLPPGIYVVRNNGHVKKMVIK